MKHNRRRWMITVCFLTVLISVPAVAAGCDEGRPGRVSYVVRQGGRAGTVIGSQSVTWSREGGRVEFKCVERRPFQVYDTTVYRKLSLTSGSMSGYYSNTRVPGASFRTHLFEKDGNYEYLADDLQTFEYVPLLATSGSLYPFEPDSACLMQSLADRFYAEGKELAVMFVVVPSISSIARQVLVKQEGRKTLNVTGEGIGEVEMKFDDDGILARASGAGVYIEKGRAGGLRSRAYQPGGAAGDVGEVRVGTPDRLAGGEMLELAGSLYVPAGKKPHRAVVLAGEFGPQDRTGGGFLSQMAEHLVRDGLAVLVCDRRGIPRSRGDYATYTLDSYVSDINAEMDFLVLRNDIDIEHISIIGYGEGGIAAGRVAASNPYVSSLVLLAAPSVPLFPDLMLEQVDRAARAGSIQGVEAEAERLNISNQMSLLQQYGGDTVELGGQELFLGWMRSQSASNPLDSIAALNVPVLVTQGTDDDLVPVEHADRLMRALEARSRGSQELALFEGLGHDFGPMVPEGEAVPYRAHPEVDRVVLERVSGWLKAR